MFERTTDGIPACERLDFWREDVLRRMEPRKALDATRPFRARLRRISGTCAEFVEHASDSILADRTAARCRQDGWDDIGIDLMLDCTRATLEQHRQFKVRAGEMHVVDYGQPSQVVRSHHRAVGLIISRTRVVEAIGPDLSALAGRRVASRGMAAVLASHMRSTFEHAGELKERERITAVDAAVEMALAMLQTEHLEQVDAERFPVGFHMAACALIRRRCTDPGLTPADIAAALSCSRAALYRAFAPHGETVAAAVWTARLELAWEMLCNTGGVEMPISQVAFRCGFLDHATFDRMFKRRYGMTPRDARAMARA